MKRLFVTLILCILSLLFLGFWEYKNILSVPLNSWQTDVSGDCAIVLTGGSNRIREGFALLVRGQVEKLIISGVHHTSNIDDILPQLVLYPRITSSNIILEKQSQTTYGNAQQSLTIAETLQCRNVILVTSQLHMYRAYRTFRATFPKEINIKMYPIVSGKLKPDYLDTLLEIQKIVFYSLWAF